MPQALREELLRILSLNHPNFTELIQVRCHPPHPLPDLLMAAMPLGRPFHPHSFPAGLIQTHRFHHFNHPLRRNTQLSISSLAPPFPKPETHISDSRPRSPPGHLTGILKPHTSKREFFFLATPRSLQNLSSPTRDRTRPQQ